jgi:predicted enzyme related to lactoylglutathione lyase
MPTRLYSIVLDALDPRALAEFWAGALGWTVGPVEGGEVPVRAPWAPDQLPWGLLLLEVPEPKSGKNRLHLDLASESAADQQATVERLIGMGAVPVDIGQGDVPWVVLADPEGNELCVLEPRETYRGRGPLAAIVVASHDPHRLAEFWLAATGWVTAYDEEQVVGLRAPDGPGPMLELLRSEEPKQGKNRLHLDVVPGPGDDQADEVRRLVRLGAQPVDVGQGDVPWVVLADPEGNELCVLAPR